MSFYLKSPANKDGTNLITWKYNYHNNRIIISTGRSIEEKYWDKKEKKPKRSFKFYPEYNKHLQEIDKVFFEVFTEMVSTEPSGDAIKAAVLQKLNETTASKVTVNSYFEEHLASLKLNKATIGSYRNVLERLNDFNSAVRFEEVNKHFMLDFIESLFEYGYETNTVGPMIVRLKSVLRKAYNDGINKSMRFDEKLNVKLSVNTTKIFLDEMECEKLFNLKGLPHLVECDKDALLVSCYTGVRFQDIWKIGKTSFVQGDIIPHFALTTKKGDKPVLIPAHPMVLKIMEKYNWKLKRSSNSDFNERIKIAGEAAGITQEIIRTSFPGNKRVDDVVKKFTMITAHTGRRSLVCNCLIAGMEEYAIMKIGGWSTYSAFEKYKRLTPDRDLKIAYKSPFFATHKLKVV